MPEEPQDHELSRLQAALRRLTPRPANIDRDRVLYEAGQAAARGNRLWAWAAFGMTVLASCLAMVMVLRSAAEPMRHVVHLPAPAPAPVRPAPSVPAPDELREVLLFTEPAGAAAAPEPDEYSYLRMHEAAMRTGLQQVPPGGPSTTPLPATPAQPVPTAGTRNYAATLSVTGDY
jgi:hypothetical protein